MSTITTKLEAWLGETYVRAVLGTSIVFCLLLNLVLYGLILVSGDRNKYEAVDTFGNIHTEYGPDVKQYFADLLDKEGIASMRHGDDQLLALLAWVGNSITSDEPHTSNDPTQVFEGGAAWPPYSLQRRRVSVTEVERCSCWFPCRTWQTHT